MSVPAVSSHSLARRGALGRWTATEVRGRKKVDSIKNEFFNDVTKDIILRKAILFLLTLACWKETLDIAIWVIYTVIVVETDYGNSSLKSRERYRQLS